MLTFSPWTKALKKIDSYLLLAAISCECVVCAKSQMAKVLFSSLLKGMWLSKYLETEIHHCKIFNPRLKHTFSIGYFLKGPICRTGISSHKWKKHWVITQLLCYLENLKSVKLKSLCPYVCKKYGHLWRFSL